MRKTRQTAEETMTLYRALREVANAESNPELQPADKQCRATVYAFLEMLGSTRTREGLTVERDDHFEARQEMAVRAERKGRRIVVTVDLEPRKP